MHASLASLEDMSSNHPSEIRIRIEHGDTWHAWRVFVVMNNYKNYEEALRALLLEKGLLPVKKTY